jgi:hypothetical protein
MVAIGGFIAASETSTGGSMAAIGLADVMTIFH